MNNPWKIATIGIALTTVTALTAGLTTAYMLRPTPTAEAQVTTQAAVRPAVYAPKRIAARPATTAPVTQRAIPVAVPASVAAPDDCATGKDRAWRIAKPGLLGTLLGAGLGAAGGAIADGGGGAGKGALIGGIGGAVAGTAYGAYNTNSHCGTIFGN